MRAARLYAPRTIRYEDIPDPRRASTDVLVRVGAVGLCGSDLHYYCDGHIGTSVASTPLVLGHEFAGTIEAVGEGVRGLQVGDRVAVDPAIPCGRCEVCLEGHPNICPNVRFAGPRRPTGRCASYSPGRRSRWFACLTAWIWIRCGARDPGRLPARAEPVAPAAGRSRRRAGRRTDRLADRPPRPARWRHRDLRH